MDIQKRAATLSPVAARLDAHPLVQRIATGGRVEMFLAPDFIAPPGVDEMLRLIDRDRRPSTIVDPNGDPTFRISETCDMPGANPAVAAVRAGLCALTGIMPAHAETTQGQRYGVGGHFKAHTDAFEPNGAGYAEHTRRGGQRTWTAMAYLNDVEEGGHTLFPALGIGFQPRPGLLLLWNNLHADGRINQDTLHHATSVTKGWKAVMTTWFRERPWA